MVLILTGLDPIAVEAALLSVLFLVPLRQDVIFANYVVTFVIARARRLCPQRRGPSCRRMPFSFSRSCQLPHKWSGARTSVQPLCSTGTTNKKGGAVPMTERHLAIDDDVHGAGLDDPADIGGSGGGRHPV